jgi:hypothetical protein
MKEDYMQSRMPLKGYKSLSVHSHPRSGSTFLVTNLAAILGQGIDLYKLIGPYTITKEPVGLLGTNPEDFQVAVIRNPKDTVFSSYAHGEKENHQSIPTEYSVLEQIDRYIEHIDIYLKFKDNIHFYDFNDLEYALTDIALKFIDNIPTDFSPKPPGKTERHTPSMKGSDFYVALSNLQLKDDIFKEANEKYREVLKLCKKPY